MASITVKLPEHLLKLIEKESRARGITKSALVRECLEKELNPRKSDKEFSYDDLASDLAGSVKGLPHDLVSNPNYMDDFGQLSSTARKQDETEQAWIEEARRRRNEVRSGKVNPVPAEEVHRRIKKILGKCNESFA